MNKLTVSMMMVMACLVCDLRAGLASEAGTKIEPDSQISFPAEVTLGGKVFKLQGVALRKKSLLVVTLKIYAIGYYTVPGDDSLKAFRVVAARDMSKSRIVGALTDAVEAKLGNITAGAEALFAKVQDSPEGQVTWYYNPTKEDYFFQQGDTPSIPMEGAVATAVYDSWLSEERTVSAELRSRLLGLVE